MRRTLLILPLILCSLALALGSLALADHGETGTRDPRELARRAVDPDPGVAEPAIAALRAIGRDGHRALLEEHDAAITALRETGIALDRAAAERLRRALDAVAAQRDAHASGLYWHTDLETALAEARRNGRPILSLRLLGRLDEELSCANSRYFRVVLYANEAISRTLADRFVLHWSSERPAPRITIDMGDGRTIERTITGNSVHYVLDPAGRVLDAIPGLSSPSQFHSALRRAETFARRCEARTGASFGACLREHHLAAIAETRAEHEARARSGALPSWDRTIALTSRGEARETPSAIEAMPLAYGKMRIERPMLRAIARDPAAIPEVEAIDWSGAAARDIAEHALDARSLALMRLKTGRDPSAFAARLAVIAAADGLRNEATLHRQIHGWLASGDPPSLETLSTRVYAELFLTPIADPWLGLHDPSLWDAVEMR